MRCIVAVALVGCLHDNLETCGDLLCPADSLCMAGGCVPAAAVSACTGASDATACAIEGLPMGVCHSGVCVARGCGNGVVEADEVCDDGNTVGGDGCTADCRAHDLCPPIGVTPKFSLFVHQPIVQQCSDYATSPTTRVAVATCYDGVQVGTASGPVDQPLESVTPLRDTGVTHRHPVLSPEGDELYVVTNPALDYDIEVYHQVGGMWTFDHVLAQNFTVQPSIGAPSQGPVRHMLIFGNDTNLEEYTITAGQLAIARVFTPAQLGVMTFQGRANLTPDGLRLAFSAFDTSGLHLFYTDRTAIDQPFREATIVGSVPPTGDSFMTASCERVYFSAISSIFYVEQQ